MDDGRDELVAEVARLRRLAESSRDLVVLVDADGTVADVNDACSRVLGYSREQILGTNAMDVVDPEDLPRATEHFQRHLERAGTVPPVDVRLRRRDGRWRWFETYVEPSDDGSYVLRALEVTERRRAAAMLEVQSEVLGLIARRAPLAEVVAAVGRGVDELHAEGSTAILCKPESAPMVWAPDLPPPWVRAVTVGLMGAASAVDGIDPVLSQLAQEHHLGTGWSTPIRDHGGRDLGRILVYPESSRPPSGAVQRGIESMADLVAIAADHQDATPRGEPAVRAVETTGDARP